MPTGAGTAPRWGGRPRFVVEIVKGIVSFLTDPADKDKEKVSIQATARVTMNGQPARNRLAFGINKVLHKKADPSGRAVIDFREPDGQGLVTFSVIGDRKNFRETIDVSFEMEDHETVRDDRLVYLDDDLWVIEAECDHIELAVGPVSGDNTFVVQVRPIAIWHGKQIALVKKDVTGSWPGLPTLTVERQTNEHGVWIHSITLTDLRPFELTYLCDNKKNTHTVAQAEDKRAQFVTAQHLGVTPGAGTIHVHVATTRKVNDATTPTPGRDVVVRMPGTITLPDDQKKRITESDGTAEFVLPLVSHPYNPVFVCDVISHPIEIPAAIQIPATPVATPHQQRLDEMAEREKYTKGRTGMLASEILLLDEQDRLDTKVNPPPKTPYKLVIDRGAMWHDRTTGVAYTLLKINVYDIEKRGVSAVVSFQGSSDDGIFSIIPLNDPQSGRCDRVAQFAIPAFGRTFEVQVDKVLPTFAIDIIVEGYSIRYPNWQVLGANRPRRQSRWRW